MSNRSERIQRTVLPIPDRPHVGLTTYDARDPDTKYPPIEPLRPPENAPNVLIILIDDHFIKPEERLHLAMAIQ